MAIDLTACSLHLTQNAYLGRKTQSDHALSGQQLHYHERG